MTKGRNRFFSILLAAVLLLSLFSGLTPTEAKAQETPEETGEEMTLDELESYTKAGDTGNIIETACKWRGRVLPATLDIYKNVYTLNDSLPYGVVTGVVKTLKQGNKVNVKGVISNYASEQRWWLRIETTIDGQTVTGYVFYLPKDAGSDTSQRYVTPCYTEDCTTYSCYADITITQAGSILSAPCSTSTDDSSTQVVSVGVGAKMEAIQLVKNLSDNYWYKVKYTSGSNTYTGYVYATDVTATPKYAGVSVSNVTLYPSGTLTQGQAMTLNGNVKSSVLSLTHVGCFVYSGTNTDGTAETGKWDSTSGTTYTIKGSNADNNCKIGSLGNGTHTYTIKVQVVNNWATSGTTMTTGYQVITLFTSTFSVGTSLTTYTVTYNANGGENAPASQQKVKDVALTLSSQTPYRGSIDAGYYTITLNANGGSCSQSSLQAKRMTDYTFNCWNTKADGSGTNYNPGASYTANANVTLYAQWISSPATSAVNLPTPTRSGYTFMGWATSTSASSGRTGYYTPSGNVTLYAIWEERVNITDEPSDVVVKAGETASFSIGVWGTVSKYQWRVSKDGGHTWTNINTTKYPSATTNNLSFTAKSTMNEYLYKCEVTFSNGTILTSMIVNLIVNSEKPVVISQPSNTTVALGDTAYFSISASGATSYQWYYSKNGGESWTKWSGHTGASFSVAGSKTNNGCLYKCKVTNALGSVYSKAATLTVTGVSKPTITTQPTNKTTTMGKKVTFSVTASGATSYQWYYSKDNGNNWVKWSGKTSSSVTVAGSATNVGCQYYCLVKNSIGSTKSNVVTLTVTDAPPRLIWGPYGEPFIDVPVGYEVPFGVTVDGSNLTYQWQVSKNNGQTWTNCKSTGNNTSSFRFIAATKYNGFQYRCIISNAYGAIVTDPVTLLVK